MSATRPLVGFTYRTELHDEIMANRSHFEILEVVADQLMDASAVVAGPILADLAQFPVVMHSLNLSLGSAHPCRTQYLEGLATLAAKLRPLWCSDHLCFTQSRELELGQLTPLPFTEEACDAVCANLRRVRAYLPQYQFLVENITNYIHYPDNDYSEAGFINQVLARSGAGLLLDINNVFVNSVNYRFDPYRFVDSIIPGAVQQVHIAGHQHTELGVLDSHDTRVSDEVWELLEYALERLPIKAVTLEWDCDFPSTSVLIDELSIARQLCHGARTGAAQCR